MQCPSCGSDNLKRGNQNLWCASCGYFPIPFAASSHTHGICGTLGDGTQVYYPGETPRDEPDWPPIRSLPDRVLCIVWDWRVPLALLSIILALWVLCH